jgi:hypothetical protein
LLHLLAHAVQPLQHLVEIGLSRGAIYLGLHTLEGGLHGLLAILDGPFQLFPEVRGHAFLRLVDRRPAGSHRSLQQLRPR